MGGKQGLSGFDIDPSSLGRQRESRTHLLSLVPLNNKGKERSLIIVHSDIL